MNPVVARVRIYRETHRIFAAGKRTTVALATLGTVFWGILILDPTMMNAVEALPPVAANVAGELARVEASEAPHEPSESPIAADDLVSNTTRTVRLVQFDSNRRVGV